MSGISCFRQPIILTLHGRPQRREKLKSRMRESAPPPAAAPSGPSLSSISLCASLWPCNVRIREPLNGAFIQALVGATLESRQEERQAMNTAPTGATETFESALKSRADAMADACTRCGRCVEVCPATEAAGLTPEERQSPVDVISGIIDIIKSGEGSDAAKKWAAGCLLSGECIKACDYGVNPRFLLYMARINMSHAKKDTAAERRTGFDAFRLVARDVPHIAKIQLDDALLARLGQGSKGNGAKGKAERADGA